MESVTGRTELFCVGVNRPDVTSRAHDRLTIVSMAVIASALATLLHEGVGHGLTAFVRGDVPTELTSNHLSSLHPDRLVQAAGTLVNLAAGAIALLASSRIATRANLRYFLWILAALNLLPGAGYFLFSGIFGFGDWNEVIRDLPYHAALRVGMTVAGAALYVLVVRLLAVAVAPFWRIARRTTPSGGCRTTQRVYSVAWRVCGIRLGCGSCSCRRFPRRSADHPA